MFTITPIKILYLLLYAILNTILNFCIIYIINNILTGDDLFVKDYTVFVFISIVVYTYLLNIIFQKELNKYTSERLYKNEKIIIEKILKSPLLALEKFGSERFYTVLEDIRSFSILPHVVTNSLGAILTVLMGLIYMFTLSIFSATIILIIIIFIAFAYFLIIRIMAPKLAILRNNDELYHKYIKDVISGFKELKLSKIKRDNLFGKHIGPNRDQSGVLDYKLGNIFLSVSMISQYGLFFLIAVILFYLPKFGFIDDTKLIPFIIVILFISGPVNSLIELQQTYTRFSVAIKRVDEFLKDFNNIYSIDDIQVDPEFNFQSLEFKEVKFEYKNINQDLNFILGPINFKIEKGEVIFVLGGNGSGKSTFLNLITGLYDQDGGEIILNGIPNNNNKKNLQNSMSAIFADSYIFSHNYENYSIYDNDFFDNLILKMQINHLITNDKDSLYKRKFSKGQSKRISLIFSLLEKKSILILDEWAADQDPYFRKIFYEELIPLFRVFGLTVIAVTHDDAYFRHADRIIRFDSGKILIDLPVHKYLDFNKKQ